MRFVAEEKEEAATTVLLRSYRSVINSESAYNTVKVEIRWRKEEEECKFAERQRRRGNNRDGRLDMNLVRWLDAGGAAFVVRWFGLCCVRRPN